MSTKRLMRLAAAVISVKLMAFSAAAQETDMQTAELNKLTYGYEREFPEWTFDEGIEKVTAALSEQGFGVLTEIDVKATMKKKLDKEYPQYKILGACNPVLADQALQADNHIGLLMPCNVVVRELEAGGIAISMMNPGVMSEVSQADGLENVATEGEALVKQVLESL